MKRFLLLLVAAILLCGCVAQQGQDANKADALQGKFFLVSKVIDGDTLVLQNGEKVRLIGIDSTEKGEPCYNEAGEKLRELVLGKYVTLERDVSDRDKYGRLVAYVFADGNFVNLEMVEEGYAFSFAFQPDVTHAADFERAEQYANANKKGCLWDEISSAMEKLNK